MSNKPEAVPKLNDEIYVETHLFISHGEDDVIGGLAQVVDVRPGISGGKKVHFVEVLEHPGAGYNWEQHLGLKQEELKAEFGSQRAYTDPDYNCPDE